MAAKKKVDTTAAAPVEAQALAVQSRTYAQELLGWAKAIVVTHENMEYVGAQLIASKGYADAVDAELKKITKPLNDALKATKALFLPATSALAEIEGVLKTKIANARNAQLAVNMQAAQAAQAQLSAGNAYGAALAATVIVDTALPAGISMRDTWEFEIVHDDLVPRELCSADPRKIRAHIALYGTGSTPHPIAGVNITKGSIVAARTAGA